MKYRKKVAMLLTMAMLATGLTGCAENQIPDLTDEELKAIGEFVAITMMKYDTGHTSRLMDLSSFQPMEEVQGSLGERNPEESVGMKPVDDTPVVDSADTNSAETNPGGEEPAGDFYSMEEVMGLPEGVTVAFQGYGLYDSYPEDSEAFGVTASAGKKLLVLSFAITNTSEQEQKVDQLSSNVMYRVTVNDEIMRKSLPTFLPFDMVNYADTLAAGGSAETVLMIEIDAETAETISSISLDMKNESKLHTIRLYGDA